MTEHLPSAISEKNAPFQSIVKKTYVHGQQVNLDSFVKAIGRTRTQLIPMTRPRLFQISPYGGSKPTASRTDATIPTTNTGVSFPASYIG